MESFEEKMNAILGNPDMMAFGSRYAAKAGWFPWAKQNRFPSAIAFKGACPVHKSGAHLQAGKSNAGSKAGKPCIHTFNKCWSWRLSYV